MSEINFECIGQVGLITIDRPKANAIDAGASRAIYEAVCRLESDSNLRVGIITGAGDKFFSAGWDLKAAAEGERADTDYSPGGFAGITEMFNRKKPLIAAVNGIAFGGGLEIALACDFIVASENAQFALPEASLGIIADAGGVIRLPNLIGKIRAAELLMTGRRLEAATAFEWGLLNRVVPQDLLIETAMELAKSISQMAPLSISAILEIWQKIDGLNDEEAFALLRKKSLPIYSSLVDSEDATEGVRAFSEKRDPNWSGK